MIRFMKLLNNISRSQAIYRNSKISVDDLQSGHYALVLSICHEPGRSQEMLAKELCLNKSTIARQLSYLEDKGYISRSSLPNNKRQFSVYPTEKMMNVLPIVKEASNNWMLLLSQDIPKDELEIFESVLKRIEKRAREIVINQEDNQ